MIWFGYGWLCFLVAATLFRIIQKVDNSDPWEVLFAMGAILFHIFVIVGVGFWIYQRYNLPV